MLPTLHLPVEELDFDHKAFAWQPNTTGAQNTLVCSETSREAVCANCTSAGGSCQVG